MDLKLIFLIILAVVSIVYLITLYFKEGIFQFILKSLLIPCILAVYISETEKIFLPVVLALVFAWIGDVLLIKISNILCFRLGLSGFLIGHICYITAMFKFAQPFNILFLVICIVIGIGLGLLIFKIIQPTPEMKIAVIAYEAIILVMAVFAVQLFAAQGGVFGALVLAGSVCFVVSDTSLALVTFRKKPYYVFVMVTYIAAQLLIALGFSAVVF